MQSRKQLRLEQYDYSENGCYFITVCTKDKQPILWTVGAGFPRPRLSESGKIVKQWIQVISQKYPSVFVDKFVIMPNHIHLLISFDKGRGNPAPTISNVIGWLKYQITADINRLSHTTGQPVFQRSFYDHIIRSEQDYRTKWNYIDTNPYRWSDDEYYFEF